MTQALNVAVGSSNINSSGVLQPAGGGTGITSLGTGVATALGVAVGSAGAPVVNGGVLGTPSSGTVTNLTGTASININGTVGATTATTGAFTTLSASSTVSGTGFSTYLASPPAIGTTAAAAGNFTNSQITSLGVGTAASGTTGEIRATNNITAFYSSDQQFKENVAPIAGALSAVESIGGKTFDWTDAYLEAHGGADGYFVQKEDFGVIAQNVKMVFPLAVRTREDGSLAVDYAKLVALAFAAIVELNEKVKVLENK